VVLCKWLHCDLWLFLRWATQGPLGPLFYLKLRHVMLRAQMKTVLIHVPKYFHWVQYCSNNYDVLFVRGQDDVTRNCVELSSQIVGMERLNKTIYVACMDQTLKCFSSKVSSCSLMWNSSCPLLRNTLLMFWLRLVLEALTSVSLFLLKLVEKTVFGLEDCYKSIKMNQFCLLNLKLNVLVYITG